MMHFIATAFIFSLLQGTAIAADRSFLPIQAQEDSEQSKLAALGYLDGYHTAPALTGVTRIDEAAIQPGYTMVASAHGPEAWLMDHNGTVLHKWTYKLKEFPKIVDRPQFVPKNWYRAHLYEDGGLLVVLGAQGLLRLDKDSNLMWATGSRSHHDLTVLPDGKIISLTRHHRMLPEIGPERILVDYIGVFSKDGALEKEVSLIDALSASEKYKHIWLDTDRRKGDLFHANSVEIVTKALAQRIPNVEVGHIIVSLRELNAGIIVDMETEKVVFAFQGSFKKQHDIEIVEGGNLVIYDNHHKWKNSAVEIYDPTTMELKWSFEGSEEEPFYSMTSGQQQMLKNGNMLIVESNNGRVIELTKSGRVVWEFYNPNRAGTKDELIAQLNEVYRVDKSYVSSWLEKR